MQDGPAGGGIRVSVVVPLYNTGAALVELVESLDAQSLPQRDFEVVLVDDGSDDGTDQIAADLVAQRDNYRLTRIPNSGWPGRPRNVGLDVARGEFVFFSDHDDRFGPQALECLLDSAVKQDADIVYGKIVRLGLTTPYWPVWAADDPDADPAGAVVTSRTVHKLFRRSLLVENGIRFREGRVRLEDHEFMAHAIPRARRISVVASTPCYWWIQRDDGTNTSKTPVAPHVYWRHYARAMHAWVEADAPAPLLDAARVTSVIQAFSRFGPKQYFGWPPQRREQIRTAVGDLLRAEFPARLDASLPVLKRLRVIALRDGRSERFDTLQAFRQLVAVQVRTEAVEQIGSSLRVRARGRCSLITRSAVRTQLVDGQPHLPLPRRLYDDDSQRRLGTEDLGTLELTIRHRTSGVEWPVPGTTVRARDELTVRTDALIDMRRTTFGDLLEPGRWDVWARVQFLGESSVRQVAVHGADRGRLSFIVRADGAPAPVRLYGRRGAARVEAVRSGSLLAATGTVAALARWSGVRLALRFWTVTRAAARIRATLVRQRRRSD